MTRLERQDPNLGADFFQRRTFFLLQRSRSVIAAFDINRRTHFFDQASHTHLRKKDDIVYTLERRDDFSSVAFGVQRTAFTFQRPNRIISVDRDNERVAERTRGLEIANVSDVQQIKAAIRQNKLAALLTKGVGDGRETIWIENFSTHGAATTNCKARGNTVNSAGSLPTSSPSTLNHIPGREFTVTLAARRKTIVSLER